MYTMFVFLLGWLAAILFFFVFLVRHQILAYIPRGFQPPGIVEVPLIQNIPP